MNKKEFIPYRSYGLGHTNNLVLSFIEMYGDTYASNQHISERLDISVKTVSRAINYLDGKFIVIDNPKGRSRFIRLKGQNDSLNQDKLSNQAGQNDQHPGQNDSVIQDKLSNNKKENKKLEKKAYNKENKKAYTGTYVLDEKFLVDNDEISSILNEKGI